MVVGSRFPGPPFTGLTVLLLLLGFFLDLFEGRSGRWRESCRLKGEASFSVEKPRHDPCLCNIEGVARGRAIAWGFTTVDVLTGGGGSKIHIKITPTL